MNVIYTQNSTRHFLQTSFNEFLPHLGSCSWRFSQELFKVGWDVSLSVVSPFRWLLFCCSLLPDGKVMKQTMKFSSTCCHLTQITVKSCHGVLQIEDLQYGIGVWTNGVWREMINVDLYFIKALCPCGPVSGSDKAVWDSRGWGILSHSIQPCSTKVFIHCNGCPFIWIWQMTLCLLQWLGSYNLFIFMLNYKSHGVCLNDILLFFERKYGWNTKCLGM